MVRKIGIVLALSLAAAAAVVWSFRASAESTPSAGGAPEETIRAASPEPSGRPGGAPRRHDPAKVFRSFLAAYPGIAEKTEKRNGEQYLLVRGTWFSWSDGKLLPETETGDPSRFSSFPFYSYSPGLPEIVPLSQEEKDNLAQRLHERERNPPERNAGLYNTIWGITDRASADRAVTRVGFLGRRVTVHRDLAGVLAEVETGIRKAMETSPAVTAFVDGIGSVSGYNFRPVAGTASVSFHSYGVAVDILPKSYGGKETYWLWAMENVPDWFELPYEKRYMPPGEVINAFERHGFIWGGKWFYFDTMHFEYRPEIFLLNDLPLAR